MLATFTMFSNYHPRRRPRWRQAVTAATLCALALLLNPTTANGQATGSVAGTVRSPGEAGISLAVARLSDLSLSASVAADGTFRFDAVPPGTYLLVVDIPSVGLTSQPVTVSAGRETTVELEHDHFTHFDEIVVTASGDLRNESELPNAISVLGGADLQLRLGATLGETLAAEPGLSSTAFVPGAARPVIRGLSSARVWVLNGGMGTGDVSVESADHAVTSDPLLAEQIEVLRGPATLRYGSGAIGGAVNVVDGRIPASATAVSWASRSAASAPITAFLPAPTAMQGTITAETTRTRTRITTTRTSTKMSTTTRTSTTTARRMTTMARRTSTRTTRTFAST